MAKDEALRLRLDKELKDKLQAIADKDGRTLSNMIRLILVKYVENQKV